MERTKREERSAILYFVIFLMLLIGVITGFFSYIYPGIKEVEELKQNTLATYNDYVRIQNSGMTFNEFKNSINDSSVVSVVGAEKKDYLNEIINNVNADFYNTNLVNKTGDSYDKFLKSQSEKMQEWSPLEKKNEIISRVLPEHSEIISDLGENSLTDFMFVNYIESIAETFSLNMENKIGISDITILNDYSVGVLDTSLETNIYYIPLKLNISGKRSDILDFLYFASHVGEVKVENGELVINSDVDSDFKSSFRNRYLKGQGTQNSIFNNQIFDIESLSFNEYIDPLTTITDKYVNGSLANYIKNTNFSDEQNYQIEVGLRFYIKGLPMYKIENYIKKFIQDFDSIQSQVVENMQNTKLNTVDRQKMIDTNTILGQLSRSIIPEIQRDMGSKETINNAFNIVTRYRETLDNYQATLNQINNK